MADTSYTNGELLGLAGKALARHNGAPLAGQGQKISFTNTAAANSAALPVDSNVMLVATQDCFIRLSKDGQDAALADGTDMYIIAGHQYMIRMIKDANGVPCQYISAVRVTTSGSLYLMPMTAE
jgi:hypothetical protein